jgi:hypothetical protein
MEKIDYKIENQYTNISIEYNGEKGKRRKGWW